MQTSRISPSCFAAFLIALGTSAVPSGAAMAQPTILRACYVPISGTVYRIGVANAPAQCMSASHVPFQWTDGTSVTGGGSSVATHAQLDGLSADDHTHYLLRDGVRSSMNGFAVSGTLESGQIPLQGPGTRFLWYPGKAALRAGNISSDQWDDARVGTGSVALGMSTVAAGQGSAALGWLSRAEGSGASVALGYNALATGISSMAAGRNATATGLAASAFGDGANASHESSVAIGSGSHAGGFRATAIGGGNALSSNAIALGGATADAPYAVAVGQSAVASGDGSMAFGHRVSTNDKTGSVIIGDRTGTTSESARNSTNNQFAVRAQHIWFGANNNVTNTSGRYIEVANGAYLTWGGTWTNASDSTKKRAFQPVDAEQVLTKVASLPLYTWQYTAESDGTRHIGPTAQAFRKAFGLGDTDKAIATVDADGVALAGVQALEQRTRALAAENAALRADLNALQLVVQNIVRARFSDQAQAAASGKDERIHK